MKTPLSLSVCPPDNEIIALFSHRTKRVAMLENIDFVNNVGLGFVFLTPKKTFEKYWKLDICLRKDQKNSR